MNSPPPLLHSTSATDVSATCKTYSLQPFEFHTLHSRSSAAKATAYCPYSQFRVGCAVLTEGGEWVDGANVENAAYPVGTCAERVTLGKAVTMPGWKRGEGEGKGEGKGRMGFRALGVCTDISPPASPCGMCRQL